MNEGIQKLLNEASSEIEKISKKLNDLREENAGTSVAEFIDLVLEWRYDSDKRMVLHEMFSRYCFPTETINFLPRFYSFVANLRDDSYFVVQWHRVKLKKQQICWKNGEMVLEPCEHSDPRSFPLVSLSGDGSQEFGLLIAAMEKHYETQRAREREIEEMLGGS